MGSAVNDLSFTSPRSPCAPPIWATQMRSATSDDPAQARVSSPARRRREPRFWPLPRPWRPPRPALCADGAGRIVALLALHHPRLVEKTKHPVGRQRALGEPSLDLVEVELEALGLVLRQQRIEIAEPLDEAAVARRTAVRDHDVIDRPLFGPGAGEPDF